MNWVRTYVRSILCVDEDVREEFSTLEKGPIRQLQRKALCRGEDGAVAEDQQCCGARLNGNDGAGGQGDVCQLQQKTSFCIFRHWNECLCRAVSALKRLSLSLFNSTEKSSTQIDSQNFTPNKS